jgi:hypothetical protein
MLPVDVAKTVARTGRRPPLADATAEPLALGDGSVDTVRTFAIVSLAHAD